MKITVALVVTAFVAMILTAVSWVAELIGAADPTVWEGSATLAIVVLVVRVVLQEFPKMLARVGWIEQHETEEARALRIQAENETKELKFHAEKLAEDLAESHAEDLRELKKQISGTDTRLEGLNADLRALRARVDNIVSESGGYGHC